jgi:hypothetical protein
MNDNLSNVRWAAALEGEPFDLEDARNLYGSGTEVRVCTIEVLGNRTPTVLVADEFQQLNDASAVLEKAQQIGDILNGVLFVRDRNRSPIRVGAVHERMPDGVWSGGTVFARLNGVVGRSRVKGYAAVLMLEGSPAPPPPPPPPHTVWMEAARGDDAIADTLTYLRGQPEWFDLYKAFETIRADFDNKNGSSPNWPSKNDIGRFSANAQRMRHSNEWCVKKGISNVPPMSLEEARDFVRSLAQAWLEWRFS